MGRRKEEKYEKLKSAIEGLREPLMAEVSSIVRRRHGDDAVVHDVGFKMVHRRVFACDVRWRNGGGEQKWAFVGKLTPPEKDEYRRMKALWDGGFNGAPPFGVRMCEPLGYCEEAGTLFMELVRGHSARTVMRETGSIEPARNAARALLQLHAMRVAVEAQSPVEEASGSALLAKVKDLDPGLAEGLDAIVAAVQALDEERADSRIAVHGDYHIAQVTTRDDDGSVWLLDFGSMFMGDPAYDIGEYLAHVEPDEEFSDVAGARRLFLDEYLAHCPDPGIRERVPPYEAFAWLRRAMHNVNQGPEGPKVARSMALRALSAMAQR